MDAHGIEPAEKVSASKQLQRDDARAIVGGSAKVIVAKGASLESFRPGGNIDDDVVDRLLGSTGNLRAPLVRAGKTTLVGFNEEAWTKALL